MSSENVTPVGMNCIPIQSNDYAGITNPDPMTFETIFHYNPSSSILTSSGLMFSEDYTQVYKTELVDSSTNTFLTTFGFEIDRSMYKIELSSADCSDKIDYDTNDYSTLTLSDELPA